MRSQFSLFQTPISLAHFFWAKVVQPGDTVIDATAGNGNDSSFLAKLALHHDKGTLHIIDIQQQALDETKRKIDSLENISKEASVHYHLMCHSNIRSLCEPETVQLIVYNLGWLPGSNKEITTLYDTTLQSIQESFNLVMKGGIISITCYPGHPEGAIEEEKILKMSQSLNPREWSVTHHKWLNRNKGPSLIIFQKAIS